jgi:hypothetical protein
VTLGATLCVPLGASIGIVGTGDGAMMGAILGAPEVEGAGTVDGAILVAILGATIGRPEVWGIDP